MSDAVIIAIIGGSTTVIVAGFTYLSNKLTGIHKQINSRMDEMLRMNKEASKAEGNLEGRKEQKEENKSKTQ
jgi:hypothetical protein